MKASRLIELCVAFALAVSSQRVVAQSDGTPDDAGNNSPTGVTGSFNGNVTTGCSYDAYTGNARRVVDDLVVPGAVGAYGLKWSRTYNSRDANFGGPGSFGLAWRHSYTYGRSSYANVYGFPDGREIDFDETNGVLEQYDTAGNLWLADGGKVIFIASTGRTPDGGTYTRYLASQLVDPYGQVTQLSYDASVKDQYGNAYSALTKVQEPGGQYLQISYDANGYISLVQAFDALGRAGAWARYTYGQPTWNGSRPQTVLTHVDYSDGTVADYSYQPDGSTRNQIIPVLNTCQDVRARGPMQQIQYEFASSGGRIHGKLHAEKNLATGDPVSTLTFPSNVQAYIRTETRGDGLQRTFHYNSDGHLQNYTDFTGGHNTILADDQNGDGFVAAVQNARGYTTSYARTDSVTKCVTQITHDPSDGTYAAFGYSSNNHYLLISKRNEKGDTTYYDRPDPDNLVKTVRYPDGNGGTFATETFSYDAFGRVLTHKLANGNYYEHFIYDSYFDQQGQPHHAGRLIRRSLPTSDGNYPPSNAAYISFTYYEPGDIPGDPWLNRIKTKYFPPNAQGLVASETYEYDRAGGVPTGAAVAGRGLVSKITHADTTYQSFEYDQYGNLAAQQDELQQRTTYSYDEYKRLLNVTPPTSAGGTTYTYEVVRSSKTAPADTHTDKSAHLKTDPMGVVTEYQYDENFRTKKLIQQDGSTIPPTTSFDYDEVGNLIGVHDPRNSAWVTSHSYDSRNRKLTQQDPVNPPSTFHYADGLNVTQIDRPDGHGGITSEHMSYDGMQHMKSHTEPTGQGGTKETDFTYTGSGMLASITDGLHPATNFQYNPADQKMLTTYPDGSSQAWGYDNVNNVISHRTPNNEVQHFTYDNRNRNVHYYWDNNAADPADFTYWPNSLIETANNPNSKVTLTYDGIGRVLTDVQQITSLAAPQTVEHTYDDANRRSTLSLAGTEYQLTYGYDSLGRFETIAGSNAQGTGNSLWFQYSYDAASNVVQRLCAMNGVAQMYTRDALGRISDLDVVNAESPQYATKAAAALAPPLVRELALAAVEAAAQAEALLANPPGPMGTPTAPPMPSVPASPIPPQLPTEPPCQGCTPPPNGPSSSSSTTPNNSGGASPVPIPNPPPVSTGGVGQSTIAHAQYTYTNLNRLWTVDVNEYWRLGHDYHDSYGYDDSGQQLSSANLGSLGQSASYSYDNAGNRNMAGYAANNLNEYTSAGGQGVGNNDGDHRINSYGAVNYSYAADGRLRSASGNVASYTVKYDALGRAVRKTYTGSPHSYDIFCAYDGQRLIYESNSLGIRAGWQLYGKDVDEALLRGDWVVQTTGQGYFYQQDRNDNVTYLTSFQGTVLEAYRYDAYGSPMQIAQPSNNRGDYNNRFFFQGREYLWSVGIYDYRNRLYHPGLGRFMSEDPLGHAAGDTNLFRYVGNDPLNETDPAGTMPLWGAAAGGAIAGAGIDLGAQLWADHWDWSKVNYTEVGISGVAGATGVGLGAVVDKAVATVAARVALNTVASAGIGTAAQVGINASNHQPLNSKIGSAAAFNAISGGIGSAISQVANLKEALAQQIFDAATVEQRCFASSNAITSFVNSASIAPGVYQALGIAAANTSPVAELFSESGSAGFDRAVSVFEDGPGASFGSDALMFGTDRLPVFNDWSADIPVYGDTTWRGRQDYINTHGK